MSELRTELTNSERFISLRAMSRGESFRLNRWLSPVAMLAVLLIANITRADSWSYWGQMFVPNPVGGPANARMATDGTNLYYSTIVDGVYRASLQDHQFSPMPMTGFPLWSDTNTNGFGVWNIAVTPQGTLVISGNPINVTTNGISAPPSSFNNTLPVFYYWDEAVQQWNPASVSGKTYPYTSSGGNFSVAPDGSLWTCSGFAPYAYRSTDGGRSFTAFDINARVPTNYFPLINGLSTFGRVFSILATPRNEIIIGTETGGYLHSTNNGQTWTSLDPHFTDTNSVNPLGRIGNAMVTGYDREGNVLCANYEFNSAFPGGATWYGTTLIGYRPSDGSYFNASYGFTNGLAPSRVVTPASGVTFTFMNQNYLLQGGIFRSIDGKHWTQFNDAIPALSVPFAPGITNAVSPGNCIAVLSNTVFVADGSMAIWTFDSTLPPLVNRPPVAMPMTFNLGENVASNLTLAGYDAEGDALNFEVISQPSHGTLSGIAPDLVYSPANNFTGLDGFIFTVNDNSVTSAPALVQIAVNAPTNTLPTVALISPTDQSWFVAPTNIVLTATVSDPDGLQRVQFYEGANLLAIITNAPYTCTLTNPPVGSHTLFARAVDKFNARAWASPVRVVVLPSAPRLSRIQSSATDVTVSWPLELEGLFLESSSDLNGPWSLVPQAPLSDFIGAQFVTTPATNQQFFRLMLPH